MLHKTHTPQTSRLAKSLALACRHAAQQAHEDALIRGLCHQGAFEVAMGAIDSVDAATLIHQWSTAMNKPANTPVIQIKRIHEQPGSDDGVRVLVDRLWPRGISKETARLDAWSKDLAPSDTLRKWFNHDPARWAEFQRRYHQELTGHADQLKALIALADNRPLTLLYAAKDASLNNAAALRDHLLSTQISHTAHITSQADLLLSGWRQNQSKVRQLMHDVTADNMTDQPDGAVNHPAWTLAHLIHYHPAILSLAQGRPVADPALAPNADIYDEGSTPVTDTSIYPTRNELLNFYLAGHAQIQKALRHAPESLFSQPPGLSRWAKAFPTTGDALVYLMLVHEAQHIGQIMVWRRAMKHAASHACC